MKITGVEAWREDVPLSRPYAISSASHDAAFLSFVRLHTDGAALGVGSCAPVEVITGERPEVTAAALQTDTLSDALVGADVRHLGRLTRIAETLLSGTPAARAAVDMALHDLFAQALGVPLVDLWGRCHEDLPTTITIGIKGVDETVAEAEEYRGRGFHHLKVKLGHSLSEDLERLHKLRERFGDYFRIRVDANGAYSMAEASELGTVVERLDLELVEQPLARGSESDLRSLPAALRAVLALDESVHGERDAIAMASQHDRERSWVLKLMKCGGISAAQRLCAIAESAGRGLMWGCMDESVVSISAALHLAYASPATRFLDLDGSFDLARDPATGGFEVVDGKLVLLGGPGLGVTLSR